MCLVISPGSLNFYCAFCFIQSGDLNRVLFIFLIVLLGSLLSELDDVLFRDDHPFKADDAGPCILISVGMFGSMLGEGALTAYFPHRLILGRT